MDKQQLDSSRPLTTDARSMNIPSQDAATVSHTQFLSESHFSGIVGSPENITTHPVPSVVDYFSLQMPATQSQPPHIQTPPTSRPSITFHSTSPGTLPAGTQPSLSTQSPGTLRSRPFSLQKDRGHEWSVFTEIMGTHTPDHDEQSSPTSRRMQRNHTERLRELFARRSSLINDENAMASRTLPATPGYEPRLSSVNMTTEPESEGSDTISRASEDSPEPPSAVRMVTRQPSQQNKSWVFRPLVTFSPLHRNILKCCVAYFIGSLFTYSPLLSGLIADIKGGDPGERTPSPSGHMVATVYVVCCQFSSAHAKCPSALSISTQLKR